MITFCLFPYLQPNASSSRLDLLTTAVHELPVNTQEFIKDMLNFRATKELQTFNLTRPQIHIFKKLLLLFLDSLLKQTKNFSSSNTSIVFFSKEISSGV